MDREPQTPIIIAMKGHPGTGKSTLSRAIAAALRIPLLDKDDIRDATLPIESHLPSTPLLNDLSYDVLWRSAATQLRIGLSVIVDSPLSSRARLDRVLSLAADCGARVKVVECRIGDEGEWRRRIEAREGGWHKPRNWGDLRKLVEGYEGGSDYEFGGVERIVVDTAVVGETVEDVVGRVLEFVKL